MRPSLDGLVFLTSNPGKAREAAALLGRPVAARPLDLSEIQSLDFVEVVVAKALAAVERLGVPVLVEDSGLSLPAWKGYPGPLTKFAVGEETARLTADDFAYEPLGDVRLKGLSRGLPCYRVKMDARGVPLPAPR